MSCHQTGQRIGEHERCPLYLEVWVSTQIPKRECFRLSPCIGTNARAVKLSEAHGPAVTDGPTPSFFGAGTETRSSQPQSAGVWNKRS